MKYYSLNYTSFSNFISFPNNVLHIKREKCFWSEIQSQITHCTSLQFRSIRIVPESLSFLTLTLKKWNRLSLILGLSDVSSQWDSGCTLLAGIPQSWYYVLLSASPQEKQDIDLSYLSLVTFTLITWFRRGLPSRSTPNLLFFSLKSISILWGDT